MARILCYDLWEMHYRRKYHYFTFGGWLIVAVLSIAPVLAQQGTQKPTASVNESQGVTGETPAPDIDSNESAGREQAPPTEALPGVDAVESKPSTVPSNYPSRQEAEEREKANLIAQQRMADSTNEIVAVTKWQLYVGSAGVFFLIYTLYLTRKSTSAAVEANRIANRALTRLEVPHLFVNTAVFEVPLTRETFDYENEERYPNVWYVVKNYGRSPAIIKEISATVYIGPNLPEKPIFYPSDVHKEEAEYVIAPGGHIKYASLCRTPITGQIMNDLGVRSTNLFFYGRIEYESLFDEGEVLGFCWRYNLGARFFERVSTPGYSYRYRNKG